MDKEERSKKLIDACGGDVSPVLLAEKITASIDDYSRKLNDANKKT